MAVEQVVTNDEIKTKLVESIDAVMAFIGKGASYAQEQAPLIAREILQFNFWSDLATFVLILLITLTYWITFVKVDRRVTWSDDFKRSDGTTSLGDEHEIYRGVGGIVGGLWSVIACFMAYGYVIEMLKIWLAPRLYLIDYLKGIIK